MSYMKGIKNQKQVAAVTGAGGVSESLANKSQLGYENNRNVINRDYSNNAKQLLAQLQSQQMANSDAFGEKMASAGNDFYKNMMTQQAAYGKAANAGGGGAAGRSAAITDGGKTYSTPEGWVEQKRREGYTEEEIYDLAKRGGLF